MAIFSTHNQRPHYFDRQQLRAEDLALEQQYQSSANRQLNRYLHGWGVVCGAFLDFEGWQADLSAGFAITPGGYALQIPEVVGLNLRELLEESPCGSQPATDCAAAIPPTGSPTAPPPTTQAPVSGTRSPSTGGSYSPIDGSYIPENGGTDSPTYGTYPPTYGTYPPTYDTSPQQEQSRAYLIARPATLLGQPRTAMPEDCGHPGNHLQPARQCDAVCLQIICELPSMHHQPSLNCTLLRQLFCPETRNQGYEALLRALQPCPAEVDSNLDYVVLARLDFTTTTEDHGILSRTLENLAYDERRLLLPTQTLQHYLSCLCTPVQPSPSPSPTATATNTATATHTATATATQTATATFTATATLTRIPTQTLTLMPTQTLTFSINPTFSMLDPIVSGAPGHDPLTIPQDVFSGIDILTYDTVRGQNTSIDELILLGGTRRSQLRELGIHSLMDLYQASTSELAQALDISEVRVAEYKDSALERMRRAEPIHLDDAQFDLSRGVSESVEAVHNIGRARGEALRNSGYASVADIANTDAATLGRVLSVSEHQAADLINDAQQRMRRL